MSFEPIAIVGQSCVLPGALSPRKLWDKIAAGKNLLSKTPEGYWRTDPDLVMAAPWQNTRDITWCDQGGYVRGFESVFRAGGFAIPEEEVEKYGTLVHWLLHAAREALNDAGYQNAKGLNAGIVFGNLSYPSPTMSEFAESVWLDAQADNFFGGRARQLAKVIKPHAINRFMSGLPAHIVARALDLNKGAFAIDAACASSLFAMKIACDKLHDKKTDLMLAGGVQGSDSLLLHIGFCTLQAMSRTGRSRPFHKNADGLVPAEGGGFVAIKRLSDAVKAGDKIHGVIRAIGLSNDGKGKGLLIPVADGQFAAMQKAYQMSGINPSQISLLECHATGTIIGDAIELESSNRIFNSLEELPIGTIKSNMGHPITASGIAGLLKVTGAMKAGIRPPTLHVDEPTEALNGTPFRLIKESEPWPSDSPRFAGISNFGFGGNNAHLILEEFDIGSYKKPRKIKPLPKIEIAVVGMGAMVASGTGMKDFTRTVFSGRPALLKQNDGTVAGTAGSFELPLMGLGFFPAALDQTLPQQLLILKATMEALDEVDKFPNKRAGVYVGMGCDGEVSRSGMCWRLPQFVCDWLQTKKITPRMKDWIEFVKDDRINQAREASAMLGAMPNIVANRINSQFNVEGQSFTVASEELSGVRCLELAIRALKAGEIDAAVVGAVDISCETVHMAAVKEILDNERQIPGDAAICLILKRAKDARSDGDKIYALLSGEADEINEINQKPALELSLDESGQSITSLIGHAHAASGLLHIAAATLACHYRALPAEVGNMALPWLSSHSRSAKVTINALGGESSMVIVKENKKASPGHLLLNLAPRLHIYSGKDQKKILDHLDSGFESDTGPARLVLAANDTAQLEDLQKQSGVLLEKKQNIKNVFLAKGIYYCSQPYEGELAFVFTGPAGAYPQMGRDLFLAMPEIVEEVISRFGLNAKDTARWILDADKQEVQTPEVMLWRSSFLSQIHAVITQKYIGLKPQAAMGFSSGESNSLFAMGAWQDMGQMAADFENKNVYTHEIGGEFNVVKKAWKSKGKKKVAWANYGILAPEDEVRKALKSESLAHIIIINAPDNFVIGGDKTACERVIDKIGRHKAYPLDYNIVNHCPEIASYADEWRKLHSRAATDVPDVRFYSSSTCSHYHPTTEKSAQAICDMAAHVLDFPRMVENAWNDGVRIFLEHGPRGRCSQWIDQILKDKEHIAISMDKRGRSSVNHIFHAMAQLKSAGVSVNYKEFEDRLLISSNKLRVNQPDNVKPDPTRVYQVHPPKIMLPDIPQIGKTKSPDIAGVPDRETLFDTEGKQIMPPAPWLPLIMEEYQLPMPQMDDTGNEKKYAGAPKPTPDLTPIYNNNVTEALKKEIPDSREDQTEMDITTSTVLQNIEAQNANVSKAHQEFLAQQAIVHKNYLEHRRNVLTISGRLSDQEIPSSVTMESEATLYDRNTAAVPATERVAGQTDMDPAGPEALSVPADTHLHSVEPADPVHIVTPVKKPDTNAEYIKPVTEKETPGPSAQRPDSVDPFDPLKDRFANAKYIEPTGPKFSKEQLEILASGKISDAFGEMFKIQDDYPRQVRLPEYPLLLVDRITGLKAEPGSMGKGIIWTETDVVAGAWYLNDIYMPAGVTIESGQCDLTLVSYLGADFKNKGKRVYRLLGCDLMYYGEPPKVGDTLCYQIHVDGHANIGDTRIFFFHYDCRINGELRVSVRNAQAGFFSDEELAASGGILWNPETCEHKPDDEAILDPPFAECTRREFSIDQVKAFSEGHVYECFGPGFELAETHSKTPKIQSGKMLLLDKVTRFDPNGGPWGRGYLRVENVIPSDAWYLTCHFKNDPCMPGTLMSDACLQAIAFYMTAMGHTLKRDGWRFDPAPDEIYHIKCRGQVTPKSQKLIYELFVEEIVDGPCPTIYGDILGTCDGLKILHIRRMGLRLVPDYPLDCWPHLLEGHVEKNAVARIGDMEFGYKSLLAGALGKPSDAFGKFGKPFDGLRHIARLPGPPYHFMSRVISIDATMGGMKTNETIEVDYDIPESTWYFDENGNRTMPFCVLMEVALQPCGWLAVFEGGPATSEKPLYFRNMDGTGTIMQEIFPDSGTIRTRTTVTNIINFSGIILINFDVECFIKDVSVYKMETGFGFFHKEALDHQVGLPATDEDRKWLDEPCDFLVDLTNRPAKYCKGEPCLPKPMLLMIDRVTGFWPQGDKKGLGRLRAEKTVDISEWFFKAHFFHDPVQPGSLGVEAMVQTLQFYMLHENMAEGIAHPRFVPIALDNPVTWKYRGQVTPSAKRISIEMDIMDSGRDEKGSFAVAEAWLWADNLRIFHVKNLCVYIVATSPDAHERQKNNNDAIDNAHREAPQDLKKIDLKIKDPIAKDVVKEIENTTPLTHVDPSFIHISKDKKTAFCDLMPLSSFPIKIQKPKNKKPIIKAGEPSLDYDKIFEYGRNLFNIGPWLFENITRSLWERFVRYVIIDDPKAFDKVQNRSLLYLGNHQIQVESMLFPLLAQVLTQRRIVTIADADHRTGWIGSLNEIVYSHPGLNYPKNIVYFDQNDRKSLFTIIDKFKEQIKKQGISVFLHTEGRLGLTCKKPVKILSSVFIDMAIESDLPVVPVRFKGGLPVEKLETTLDFPVGYAKQDYYIGTPILPETLKSLNYADRRKMVINAINNLGGSNRQETPSKPDPHFIKAVKSWRKQTGTTEVKAVIFKALDMLNEIPEKETHEILLRRGHGEIIKFEDNDKGLWLKRLADWLFE
ncbi:MAG: beta-ketoacyl synthase N-terminal-like domain-containing protein [Dissulfuribacterales bacterium]